MDNQNVQEVVEKYIKVSESRIKNTIKEYKSGLPFRSVISASFSCVISFFVAFVSYSGNESVWKWIFLTLLIISFSILLIFGIISIVRRKTCKGTEKWFLEEIRDYHPVKTKSKLINSKLLFIIINLILIIGIPLAVLLGVLGCNGWDISNQNWAPVFWIFWGMFMLSSLVFGTSFNAFLANIIFGYEYDSIELFF